MARADGYLDPYRDSHRRHGAAFEVTLWASPQSQRLRFEVMTQLCFFAGKRVLDAGCSRGDFAAFLQERDIAYRHYVGIDGLSEVIRYAQSRGLPRTRFVCGDFAADPSLLREDDPQIVAISGALNTMEQAQALAVLDAAWSAASETLIFNFLSDRIAPRVERDDSGPARRFDTLRILDWALGRTPYVAFRQDYFHGGHDATVMMRKHARAAGASPTLAA